MATILILGAYGFIGAEVTRACIANGHQVQVFGRDADQLTRLGAAQIWCRDLRDMLAPGDWSKVLSGVEIIVNASGVLQDGPRDDVDRVQRLAIAAMAKAADQAGVRRIVQISAVGADAKADTAFMATKGMADRVLLDGPVEVIVLRPGLVLGRSVYGGTALLRMLAAVPALQPIAFGDACIQTVAMDDVVSAVDHDHNPGCVRDQRHIARAPCHQHEKRDPGPGSQQHAGADDVQPAQQQLQLDHLLSSMK